MIPKWMYRCSLIRRLARTRAAFFAPDIWGDCRHHAPDLAPGESCEDKDCHLDPGIYELVWGLFEAGVEPLWSCQGSLTGGSSHAHIFPMIGVGINDEEAGPRARDIALSLNMPLRWLHRVESVDERVISMCGQPAPLFWWELVFDPWVNWSRVK